MTTECAEEFKKSYLNSHAPKVEYCYKHKLWKVDYTCIYGITTKIRESCFAELLIKHKDLYEQYWGDETPF